MKKNAKVLIVEDDHRNLRLMEAILLPLGYDVIMARDGEEALEKVREMPPDLILLDIIMPKIDGFEVARRLKEEEETKIIPIVMVTALRDVENRVKALEVGADDFISKPVERTELKARIQSLLKIKAYNDHLRDYQKELEVEVTQRTKQLKKALERIKAASLDTIYRLSQAAEYKDEDTGAHIQRISHFAAAIAGKMGLDDRFVQIILYASSMHDVGKIGIPDRILLKPGKLDADEWKIMKQHTTIGGEILGGSDAEFIKLAEVISLTHHERWDGRGYPKGLKGTKIPLAGRIAAVADVFDALTSKRPYRREPLSLEKTFSIIRKGRGIHFDPKVVDAFFAAEDEILSIKEEYKDKHMSLINRMAAIK